MITALKNKETITMKLFGKDTVLKVFSTGDNKYDEFGDIKPRGFDLSREEIDVLNWFIDNVRIEDYRQEIAEYCNEQYDMWSDNKITADDVEDELDIHSIAINVTETWKSKDGYVYPEISFYGECQCDEEHGICIGFRDKAFLGINEQDWTL